MSNLIGRVQNILLTPRTEWPVIAAEPDTIGGLYTKYILIVSAIVPIALFLKFSVIGMGIPFVGTYRMAMGSGLGMAVSHYVAGLIGVFLYSLVINVLAPSFGGQKDGVQALKAAAYSLTGIWIAAGIAYLIPWLAWLIAVAGIAYGVFLLYVGLPHTMKSPVEKAAGYTAVSIIAAFVLAWIFWSVVNAMFWSRATGPMDVPDATISGSGKFEPNSTGAALEAFAKKLEAASKAVDESAKQNDGVPSGAAIGALVGAAVAGGKGVDALPTETIKGFLPETLGGLPRTSAEASRNAAMGFQVAEASAAYSDGSGKDLHLEIHDAGGAKGILALASWANVEEQKEWRGGYEKTYRDGGRIVHERWDSGSKSGEYSLIAGDRFSVEVSGSADSIDALKAALGTVNMAGLEAAAAAQPASAPAPTG